MDFNFDELEDDAECLDVRPMSAEDFECLLPRLQRALEGQDYADLDRAVAEALWVKSLPRERVQSLVQKLVKALSEVASRKQPSELLGGCALAHVLARFAMSRSLDRVTTRPLEHGAPVALILGAAGGDAEEATAREDFYAARGVATVAACRCVFPSHFERYQEVQLATELQECLGEGARLLAHLCGPHGQGLWGRVAALWGRRQKPFHRLPPLQACLAGIIWECGPAADVAPAAQGGAAPQEEPEDDKPSLTLEQALSMQKELHAQFSKDDFMSRLEDLEETHKMGSAKFIAARNKLFLEVQAPIILRYGFEGSHKGVMQMLAAAARWNSNADYRRGVDRLNCLLGINAEGSKEHVRRVDVAHKEQQEPPKQQAQQTESGDSIQYEGDTTGMAACMDRCIRALVAEHLPDVQIGGLMLAIKDYVSGASTRGAFWHGDDYALKTDLGHPLWGRSADWASFDPAMLSQVPRLFLFSKTDKVIPPEVVEAHIKAAEEEQSEAGGILRQEVQGPHMRLWQSNRPACERAVLAMLKKACVSTD